MDTELIDTRHGPMWIFSGDPGCSGIMKKYGEFSEAELALMKVYIGPESVVVDAGAHIGAHTIPLARVCKKVYAFEPQAEVLAVLHQNLALNGIENVEVLPYALGAKTGKRYYSLARSTWKDSIGSVAMEEEKVEGSTEVDEVAFDDLGIVPNFMKIDVEGMELHVLAGAAKTLTKYHPQLFLERQTDAKQYDPVFVTLGYRFSTVDLPIHNPMNWKKAPSDEYSGMAHMMLLTSR